ncbi:MAG: DUF4253 domain-containing protein [Firmicutes bacterium]|nr:DUF4253 domain-containing protein [Bacillota bacterium]
MRKDLLGCEYEYFEDTMGSDIYARYKELASQGRVEGFTPLVIIPSDPLIELFEELCAQEDAAAHRERTIAEAAQADAQAYFRTEQERLEKSLGKHWMPQAGDFCFAQPDLKPPLCYPAMPEEEALIVKVPTRNPWEVAVWFPMGGFNYCPGPMEQAAVFRYWYEKYGAVPVVLMGHDTWILQVDRPPESDADCEALAREHFIFCLDIRPPLGDTIREIASHLRGATTWGFWWD